jgi:hypothetical protein
MATPTREETIAALKTLVDKGVTNPFDVLYNEGADEETKKVKETYDAWLQREKPEIEVEESVKEQILESTLLYDAGFTDPDLLDEIAHDWLLNAVSIADYAHRRDLAEVVYAKINEIEEKLHATDPSYEITDYSQVESDWNPSRLSTPAEFYADYAYWKRPGNFTIDDVFAEYKRLHPEAEEAAIKAEMEEAAKTYKETA